MGLHTISKLLLFKTYAALCWFLPSCETVRKPYNQVVKVVFSHLFSISIKINFQEPTGLKWFQSTRKAPQVLWQLVVLMCEANTFNKAAFSFWNWNVVICLKVNLKSTFLPVFCLECFMVMIGFIEWFIVFVFFYWLLLSRMTVIFLLSY